MYLAELSLAPCWVMLVGLLFLCLILTPALALTGQVSGPIQRTLLSRDRLTIYEGLTSGGVKEFKWHTEERFEPFVMKPVNKNTMKYGFLNGFKCDAEPG